MLFNLSGVSKYFGSTQLFDNISFEIGENDKVGLVGVNGAGKTTLFKILTKELPHDGGEIYTSKDLKLGYMQQYVLTDDNKTIFDEVLKVFDDLIKTEQQLEDINLDIELQNGDVVRLTEKQHTLSVKYENEGGFVYKSRIKATLMGLGFSEEDFCKRTEVLSGGEMTRVQLAKLLLANSNLLLLDEPTNHLDISAMEWLENFLVSYNGAVVVISHDRYFLDRVANKIFELDYGKLTVYSGNYSAYLQKKQEMVSAMESKYDNTMREIKRIEGIIEQQKRWNRERNIKTAESKQKMIDRLEQTLEAPPEEQEEIRFEFTANKSGGNDVLTAQDLKMSFDGRIIFKNVNMHIRRGERIFLLGPNGCGKTTLFKTLLEVYAPQAGEVKIGANIEIGYYDQTQNDLDIRKNVIDEIWDAYPKKTQTEIRNACAAFLFKGEDVFKDIDVLSGGEKARVSLLKLMLSGSNFLMLDEPTNHLDISSKEALENAFSGYDGTMFIISHDRYFINKLADKIYRLTPGGIKAYDGNYDYYIEKFKEETEPAKKEQKLSDYRFKKEQAAQLRKLKNNISKTEDKIELTEQKITELEESLGDPQIAADYNKIIEITNAIDKHKLELELLYAEWENLHNELNEFQQED